MTSSYLSMTNPLRKSLSALTTRKDEAPGRCFWRNASAARIRRSKNSAFTSTRSGASTHGDFGLGIVPADAQKALAVVLHLHQFAVRGGLGQPQDRTGVNPRMTRQNPVGFAGSYPIPSPKLNS